MKQRWARWVFAGMLAMAGVGLSGCEDDDDGSGESGMTVRVTNTVDGVETVTEVAASEEPSASPSAVSSDEAIPVTRRFSGAYSGGYENEDGRTDLQVNLINTDGVLSGTFATTGGASGTLSGTQRDEIVRLQFREDGSGRKMTFQGTLNETGSIFSGTWTDNLGNAGDSWLRRMK